MKRFLLIAIAIISVPVFILGYDMGTKAGAEEKVYAAATAKANAENRPVLANVSPDGTQHWQLPTIPQWPEFYDQQGNFTCPDPDRLRGESKQAWFKKWAKIVAPFVESKYGYIITEASRKYGVDRTRIIAKIVVESCGDPKNVSPAGAMGLMQLMPETADIMEVRDPFDPYQNIMGGTAYFRYLVDKFHNIDNAMAAYNIGETKVRAKIKAGYDYSDYKYVRKVKTAMAIAKRL